MEKEEFAQDMNNGPAIGSPLDIVSGLSYMQPVWVLQGPNICEGKVVAIHGTAPSHHIDDVQVSIRFEYGHLCNEQRFPRNHVFESRQALVDHIIG